MSLADDLENELSEQSGKKRKRRTKEELLAAGYYDDKQKPDVAPDKKTRQPRNYAAEVAGLLMPLNEMVRMVPLTTNDALTQEELERAIVAGNMAARRYPKFRQVLKQAETVTLAGAVITLALSIGLRVADNHNWLSPHMKEALKGQFTRMQQQQSVDAERQERQGMGLYPREPAAPDFFEAEMGYTPAGYNGNGGMPTVAPVFPPR